MNLFISFAWASEPSVRSDFSSCKVSLPSSLTIESPLGLIVSLTGEDVALSSPYSRKSLLASSWLRANNAVRSRGKSREGVGGTVSGSNADLSELEVTLLMGVGAGACGNVVVGVASVESPSELERLMRMTGDCSGVGRGRRRGLRRACGPGTVWRELYWRASLELTVVERMPWLLKSETYELCRFVLTCKICRLWDITCCLRSSGIWIES